MSDQTGGGISVEMLRAAAESAATALREKEQALALLRAEVERDRSELDLLVQLIHVREGGRPTGASLANGAPVAPGTGRRTELLEALIRILEDRGTPLAIGELMDALGEKRALLPGQQTQANLISVMRTDGRFIRTERGVYGLSSWGVEPYVPPSKAVRSTRQRRATGHRPANPANGRGHS